MNGPRRRNRPPAEAECLAITRVLGTPGGPLGPLPTFAGRVRVVTAVRTAAIAAVEGRATGPAAVAAAVRPAVLENLDMRALILEHFGGRWPEVARAVVDEFWRRWFDDTNEPVT